MYMKVSTTCIIYKYDLLGVEGGFKPDDENRMT